MNLNRNDNLEAQNRTGRVIDVTNGKGIVDVVVTDGRTVVTTNAYGNFELPFYDEPGLVYLSFPSGYRIPCDEQRRSRFYRYPDEDLMFELEPDKDSQREFSFIHITDIHLGRGGWDRYEYDVIPEINSRSPNFVVVTGDIAFQEGIIQRYLDLTAQFDMPLFHAIGNHEMMMHRLDPKKDYKELLGPTYYSFNYGQYHFVVLDGCLAAPYRSGFREVIGHVDKVQINWLEQDLQFIPKERPVIVFIHIPIISAFSARKGLNEKELSWEIINNREIISVLAGFNVKFVFQGHMHYNEHWHEQNIHFIESGSISGSWWNGNNVDGAPQGYRVIKVAGENSQQMYQPLGLPIQGNRFRIENIALNFSTESAQIDIAVNVFDGDRLYTKVFFKIGQSEKIELLPDESCKHPHMWRGRICIDDLPDGEYGLEVLLEQSDMLDVEHCSIFIKKPQRGR